MDGAREQMERLRNRQQGPPGPGDRLNDARMPSGIQDGAGRRDPRDGMPDINSGGRPTGGPSAGHEARLRYLSQPILLFRLAGFEGFSSISRLIEQCVSVQVQQVQEYQVVAFLLGLALVLIHLVFSHSPIFVQPNKYHLVMNKDVACNDGCST
jgi:hypothetical protein